jgi:hypothetical protein
MIQTLLAFLVIAVLGSFAAACGSDEQSGPTLYLKRDIGNAAPTGQVAPVLAQVIRPAGEGSETPAEVLALLSRGPTSGEVTEGFLPTIPDSVRVLNVSESAGTVTVDFAGSEPHDFYTHAATVLSLTELAEFARWCFAITASRAASTTSKATSSRRLPARSTTAGRANRAICELIPTQFSVGATPNRAAALPQAFRLSLRPPASYDFRCLNKPKSKESEIPDGRLCASRTRRAGLELLDVRHAGPPVERLPDTQVEI